MQGLHFEAIPEGTGTRLVQTAFFTPTGFVGWLYRYGINPVHSRIFSDLISAVAREAVSGAGGAMNRMPGLASGSWRSYRFAGRIPSSCTG